MLPLFDAANNPTQSTTPPEETGSSNPYPSLAEMEKEENTSLDSDHSDSLPTSDATPPVLHVGQSVVLLTSNPPPYEWKAKCAHCTQEIGFNEGPQYKCSTCPNYFLCDICQNVITEEKIHQGQDNHWDYLLPHAPTHSVYKTEAPDPSSPSVLHTSHPPHGTEADLSPKEDSVRNQCFCALHADTEHPKNHNTPECPAWQLVYKTAEGLSPAWQLVNKTAEGLRQNDAVWSALCRHHCCIGCLMQGHTIHECTNFPPKCPRCQVNHSGKLLCKGMEEEDLNWSPQPESREKPKKRRSPTEWLRTLGRR